ncbi:undecaprenyl-diphosphate phosphatase [Crocinitomicaceae bacterium]|nr:undecaprenyl-diphosphate phosphatase [Crocinitomicaceae bacterium]
MDLIEAIVLGIIQGLTEFLPVSSSGHLELGKAVLGSVPEEGMLMTIVLHFATALSTIVIFRKDILQIFKGLFQFKNNEESRFSLYVVISMIPAAIIGILFEDQIDSFFSGNLGVVGAMLIVTGGLLFVADRARETKGKVTITRAIIVGIAQAIAILPGISRSGATIGTSVLLGIDRQRAARFSFLMVVPLILGAMAVKTKDYMELRELNATADENKRAAMIVEELEDDIPSISNGEVVAIIAAKERDWAELKEIGVSCSCQTKSLRQRYKENLGKAGLKNAEVEKVMADDFAKIRPFQSTSPMILGAGFLAAFITGLFACTWMIRLVKRSKLKYFAFYCFAVGIAAIAWSLF